MLYYGNFCYVFKYAHINYIHIRSSIVYRPIIHMSGQICRHLCCVAGCFLTKSFVEYARAWSASRSTCSTLVKTSIEDLMRMGPGGLYFSRPSVKRHFGDLHLRLAWASLVVKITCWDPMSIVSNMPFIKLWPHL